MNSYTFNYFDKAARQSIWYGSDDLTKLEKMIYYKNHQRNKIACPGITLVVGMPLAKIIQKLIFKYQQLFQQAINSYGLSNEIMPVFRDDLSALHSTIYGLVKPENYLNKKNAWTQISTPSVQEKIRNIVIRHLPLKLCISGWGIMGDGAIVLRLSDSEPMIKIREGIAQIFGRNNVGYTEQMKHYQIGIGRIKLLQPFTEEIKLKIENEIVEAGRKVKKMEELVITGKKSENSIWLVHYMNESLTKTYEMIRIY